MSASETAAQAAHESHSARHVLACCWLLPVGCWLAGCAAASAAASASAAATGTATAAC